MEIACAHRTKRAVHGKQSFFIWKCKPGEQLNNVHCMCNLYNGMIFKNIAKENTKPMEFSYNKIIAFVLLF